MITETIESGGEVLARITRGHGPVVCVALHAGHALSATASRFMQLSDEERLREEDPYTARFAPEGATLVEVSRSRFEVDLNRPRESCVYRVPDDAWGLTVYRRDAPESLFEASRRAYDVFYERMADLFDGLSEQGLPIVVFDLHSYNHRRDGARAPAAPLEGNPEVNLGTRSVDRDSWGKVIDAFCEAMTSCGLDVRENVKFGGGEFSRWVNGRHEGQACALAIEYKKTFMDEWTGRVDDGAVARLAAATATARDAVVAALDGMQAS